MATKDDRRAALLLLVVALAGGLVRLGGLAVDAPGAIGYQSGSERRPGRDSVDAASARMSRPLGMGERIDLDRAEASDLARLPRIGPALAARIVNDRKLKGPFGSLQRHAGGVDERVPHTAPPRPRSAAHDCRRFMAS